MNFLRWQKRVAGWGVLWPKWSGLRSSRFALRDFGVREFPRSLVLIMRSPNAPMWSLFVIVWLGFVNFKPGFDACMSASRKKTHISTKPELKSHFLKHVFLAKSAK